MIYPAIGVLIWASDKWLKARDARPVETRAGPRFGRWVSKHTGIPVENIPGDTALVLSCVQAVVVGRLLYAAPDLLPEGSFLARAAVTAFLFTVGCALWCAFLHVVIVMPLETFIFPDSIRSPKSSDDTTDAVLRFYKWSCTLTFALWLLFGF